MKNFNIKVLIICMVISFLLMGCGKIDKENNSTTKKWDKETNVIYDMNVGEMNRIKATCHSEGLPPKIPKNLALGTFHTSARPATAAIAAFLSEE